MAKQDKNIRLYNRTRKLVQAQLAEPGWTQARILANTTIKGATLSRICQGQRVSRKTTLQHILDELGTLEEKGLSRAFGKARRPKDTVSPSHFKVVPPGKVHREIFALLEVRWSELGGYAIGWNDKRVAACIGITPAGEGFVSEQTVLEIRESAFGPAEGTAVAALETKIAEVEALIVALTKDMTKLRGKR